MSEASPVQRQLDAYNAHDVEAFLACYAGDVVVRHGDGRVLMTGHDEMRTDYSLMFERQPEVRAVVVNRLQAGAWVVDEEVVSTPNRELHALVGYRVEGELIQDVVLMTPGS